jgi:hypothetical protein
MLLFNIQTKEMFNQSIVKKLKARLKINLGCLVLVADQTFIENGRGDKKGLQEP